MSLSADARVATKRGPLSSVPRALTCGGICLVITLCSTVLLRAQSTAPPAAQSTSANPSASVSTAVAAAGANSAASLATPASGQNSPHLVAVPGPAPEDLNRKALEQFAGKDAGKLLVRSVPNRSRIYINGAFVGYTPQLFLLAPGKYKVEMRGQRDNVVERTVGMLPNDTQEMTVNLMARYPRNVTSH